MISTMTQDTQNAYEQVSLSSEQTLSATPFPRKYIHSVFNDRQDALQAARALSAAGYDARDIYILTNSEYVEAVGRGQTLIGALTSMDLDVYAQEAQRGCTILAVRLRDYEQILQVRDLLAPCHAHLVKYIGTWTVAQLLA